ncbi:MAG TPA: sigma-54 dependent transcriptional regulator [Verrucomicrobiae bacterium]|jgi:DNA-binding NtrC family response regulator|nr:sigma-54 dependent transcriptional regulator [Verrucomicrobiae bacterium]
MGRTESAKLLAIDDDAGTLELISDVFAGQDIEILLADDAETGIRLFLEQRPKIVLLDYVLPETSGIEVLDRLLAEDPAANVIMITGHYSTEAAIEAIQKGACDYLTKPVDMQRLRDRVSSVLSEAEIRRKTLLLDQELLKACQFEGIVSRSPLMLEVFAKIRRVAPHFRTTLLTGATGTGKELVARALHRLSPAQKDRFVAVNCSGLVENLAESELFGYARGAFTGAVQDRAGLFESADRGTIFLDEVGELTLAVQSKLLRVLQDRQVRRVGASASRAVDLRVVAATNRDLRAMVRDGKFREDLYYRLAVVEIALPGLANRREDLPLLQRHFLQKFAAEYRKSIAGLTRRAQSRMATYSWPGNVRELENVIGNACMMAEGKFLDVDDLPQWLQATQADQLVMDESHLSLEEVQRRHILRVLEAVGGNKMRAAEILGVGRATIYQILARMKVEGKEESA